MTTITITTLAGLGVLALGVYRDARARRQAREATEAMRRAGVRQVL